MVIVVWLMSNFLLGSFVLDASLSQIKYGLIFKEILYMYGEILFELAAEWLWFHWRSIDVVQLVFNFVPDYFTCSIGSIHKWKS